MSGFGLDLRSFIYQAVNFLVLLGLLSYFLHKPLISFLDKRRKEISDSLQAASRARAEVQENAREKEVIIKEAREQAHAIIEETRAQAGRLEEKLKHEAAEEAKQIIARAEAEISQMKKQMQQEFRQDIAKLVVGATDKILDQGLDEGAKKYHLEHIVKDLEG